MLLRVRPLVNLAWRRLNVAKSMQQAATDITIVQSEEIETSTPPAYLPGSLEKVTEGAGTTRLALEMEPLSQTITKHAPVIAYHLKKCLVHDGGVEFKSGSLRKHYLKKHDYLTRPISDLPKAIYCMTQNSHLFFGHWLSDACATAQLQRPDESLLLDVKANWTDAAEYTKVFGFKPLPSQLRLVEDLTIYQDYGQGSHRRARHESLRRKLASAYSDGTKGPTAVYLRRGKTGASRLISNEDAVVTALVNAGFRVVDMETATPNEIYNSFKDAQLAVSIDGSHLNHLYYSLPHNAVLVTLTPSNKFTMVHIGYASGARLRYGFLVVEPTGAGYHVDIPDLFRTLDLTARR